MVQLKYVENDDFYANRRKHRIFRMLALPFLGVIIISLKIPIWWAIPLFALFLFFEIKSYQNMKKMLALSENKMLTLDETELRIVSKKGELFQQFPLNNYEEIRLSENLRMHEEKLSDVVKDLEGHPQKSFIVLKSGKESKQFDFLFDSYYKINQMTKLIASWEHNGMKISRISA